MNDSFNGDNAALCSSIDALLTLDACGALVPHGVGGQARKLLEAASARLRPAEKRTPPPPPPAPPTRFVRDDRKPTMPPEMRGPEATP